MQEIERKFLVREMPAFAGAERVVIDQGYLVPGENGIEVRLRGTESAQVLTVKRKSAANAIEREEYNVPLTAEQWSELWPLTAGRRLRKERFKIPHGSLTLELDVYRGRNEGFAVVEVEFENVEKAREFAPPEWFGREVTGEAEFSNPCLAVE
jgi:adenylate cyclase